MSNSEKFKLVEERLKGERKLILNGLSTEEFSFTSISNLLGKTESRQTLHLDTGSLQCLRKTYRSSGDLYRIALTYGFDGSYEEFFNLIVSELKAQALGSWLCTDINKRVYFATNSPFGVRSSVYNSEPIDEWGITIDKSELGITLDSGHGTYMRKEHVKFEEGFEPA